ncbi:MAG: hypothetical protein KKE62_13360 [Proteobacteria bacterium]|nr:hypothetical protein [Pseudomonadota bacterium]MBU1389809.1 hypothetical protein [Pseudomonadota bacterium]MBU1543818.1 hypothetical protein [Pseudomonadota bacterium]MBU2483040.1 hypothetical protein [Pseudomonadota bacterium]
MSLKSQIKNYSGDGDISLLDAPFLGAPGCMIKMPAFNLSNKFTNEYSLSGIPAKMKYIVFLVVPDPCPMQEVLQGELTYQIKKDGLIIKEVSSKIRDLRNSDEPGRNRFYFSLEDVVSINVDGSGPKWSLFVNSTNIYLKASVTAHIEILSGGFK